MKKILFSLALALCFAGKANAYTDVKIIGIGIGVEISSPVFTGSVTITSTATITGAAGGYGLEVSSNVNLAGGSVLTNNGNVALTGNETVGGTLGVTGHTSLTTANITTLTAGSATVTGTDFSVGGSTLIVINGMVGIGKTPSLTMLDILDGTNRNGVAIAAGGVNGTYYPLVAKNYGGTKGIWVRDNGHLGINVGSPTSEIHIKSDMSPGTFVVNVSSQNDTMMFGVSAEGSVLVSSTLTVTGNAFSVGGSSFAVQYGNVGIGTASPDGKLDIQTTDGPTAISQVWSNGGDANGEYAALYQMADDFLLVSNKNGSGAIKNFHIGMGGSDTVATSAKLTVLSGGNVGIGDTAPSELLEVAGGIASYSRTMAQLLAITPSQVGVQYFCNNCTPAKMVVSTGTSAGNFADIMGGTFQ